MTARYLSVLLSVLALTLIVNNTAVYAAEHTELTKKEKRIIKRIARKQAKKQINKTLPLGPEGLAPGAVITEKIGNEAVNATKIEPGAVGTVEIADDAVTTNKLAASCPVGTKASLGKCFETALRASKNFFDAMKFCESLDARLPSVGELYATLPNELVGDNIGEHTDSVDSTFNTVRVQDTSPNPQLDIEKTVTVAAYRCVFDPFRF